MKQIKNNLKQKEKQNQREMAKKTPYFKSSANAMIRTNELVQLIRKGKSKAKLIEYAKEEWGVNENMATKYIHDACLKLESYYEKEAQKAKVVQLERIESILEDALNSKDNKTALSALDMINKLYSLYVDKQEVKVDSDTIKFTFDS